MNIRTSTHDDIDIILHMYDHSRGVMRADGNMTQWVGYPTKEDVKEDIERGASYIMYNEQCTTKSATQNSDSAQYIIHSPSCTPVGTFALVPGEEPTYGYIDHGRWIDEQTPYSTLHRLAAMPNTSGIADLAFRYAKEHAPHLRVDTHHDNRPMRHILEKEGFVYCGVIYMPDGSPRDAYEWWRYDCVPDDLKEYVEKEILPRHEHYDAAHHPDHIRRVIARAMCLGERLKVKGETADASDNSHLSPFTSHLIYAAASMHDIGICEGREVHHLASGRIIRSDKNLHRWFTDEEIETIAQAAEDHRASATSMPRSLLGCILSEADRDIEPETIVRRTVEYGLSHYPTLDREGHWQRTLEHLHEKYAEGGYLKLWMNDSPNDAPLADLRALIKDEEKLRMLFDKLFNENA